MDIALETFDDWLKHDGPAAVVLREHLVSVEGEDGVIFPPTFAAGDDFPGGYNIDPFSDGSNICLIDSVGSQANRIEPIFAREPYAALVPQVVVVAGTKRVSLLVEAGHRAADAIVRCSSLRDTLRDAFRADLDGNAIPLAKIAPTSLVFGVWDSRDTQAKRPRLVSSTIRAFDVKVLHRSAVYNRAIAYDDPLLGESGEPLLSPKLLEKEEQGSKRADSKTGFANALASWSHGGVIATKGVRREASLHLSALRLLRGVDAEATLGLQRYVLGLALTAFTFSPSGYLRQGCNLVLDEGKSREVKIVFGDGRRPDASVDHEGALAYAKLAAKDFVVGEDVEAPFSTELATKELDPDSAAKKPKEEAPSDGEASAPKPKEPPKRKGRK